MDQRGDDGGRANAERTVAACLAAASEEKSRWRSSLKDLISEIVVIRDDASSGMFHSPWTFDHWKPQALTKLCMHGADSS